MTKSKDTSQYSLTYVQKQRRQSTFMTGYYFYPLSFLLIMVLYVAILSSYVVSTYYYLFVLFTILRILGAVYGSICVCIINKYLRLLFTDELKDNGSEASRPFQLTPGTMRAQRANRTTFNPGRTMRP